jgi:16S rRNA C1402 N4-methylase RsmH
MKLEGVLPFARSLLRTFCKSGDIAIDATCGNGHDTLLLSTLVGSTGHVYAFDIQDQAIQNAKDRLTSSEADSNVTFFHQSHDRMMEVLPASIKGKVAGAVFNLGYLPGSDKTITTKGDSTIQAIEQLMELLRPGGIIVLVIYHGHEEGKLEKELLMSYVSTIRQRTAHVLKYEFMNQQNDPPFIVAIEKKAGFHSS